MLQLLGLHLFFLKDGDNVKKLKREKKRTWNPGRSHWDIPKLDHQKTGRRCPQRSFRRAFKECWRGKNENVHNCNQPVRIQLLTMALTSKKKNRYEHEIQNEYSQRRKVGPCKMPISKSNHEKRNHAIARCVFQKRGRIWKPSAVGSLGHNWQPAPLCCGTIAVPCGMWLEVRRGMWLEVRRGMWLEVRKGMWLEVRRDDARGHGTCCYKSRNGCTITA